MLASRLKRLIIGKPLTSLSEGHVRIPKWKALSTLSSDALSSVAYATDSILFVFAGAAAMASGWTLPVAAAICFLLVIITASYWQTISAYPNGGGAYTVARENLGQKAGLIAGAALMIDYTLTVSVSVAAGVENITSAFPWLLAHKVLFGVWIVLIIMLMNLRGIRESATVFAFPTYFFILSVFVLILAGAWRILVLHDPVPVAPALNTDNHTLPLILLLRAFASGCAALTGVEAISNGVPVFEEPAQKNAKVTLLWMSTILAAMFLGITALTMSYGLIPTEDQTIISLLGRKVFGPSVCYYIVQFATALILFLAANTSYADFPRLASLLARDRYLPRQLASMGDRLVFSNGILGLSIAAAVLLILFNGDTHQLIPLYAVGVFLSFTLSQAGMVVHHIKERELGFRKSLALNALGAVATAVVLLDITFTKFIYGAWMVVVTIPILVWIFTRIHRHYLYVGRELSLQGVASTGKLHPVKHTVVIPISGIHRGVIEALRYAVSVTNDVRACCVEIDPETTARLREEWKEWAPGIPLVVLKSPYRSVIEPLIKYIDDVASCENDEMVTVVVPEFVTSKWWHSLLHNQTAFFIRAALLFKRNRVVTSVRYHLREEM